MQNEDKDSISCRLYVILEKTCYKYFYDKYKDVFKMQGLIGNMCYDL